MNKCITSFVLGLLEQNALQGTEIYFRTGSKNVSLRKQQNISAGDHVQELSSENELPTIGVSRGEKQTSHVIRQATEADMTSNAEVNM